nr:MAG TPA: hypothetical protein [Caudoviricetes sp.]
MASHCHGQRVDFPRESRRIRGIIDSRMVFARRLCGRTINELQAVRTGVTIISITANFGHKRKAEPLTPLLAEVSARGNFCTAVTSCKLVGIGIGFNGGFVALSAAETAVKNIIRPQVLRFTASWVFIHGSETIPRDTVAVTIGILDKQNALRHAKLIKLLTFRIPLNTRHMKSSLVLEIKCINKVIETVGNKIAVVAAHWQFGDRKGDLTIGVSVNDGDCISPRHRIDTIVGVTCRCSVPLIDDARVTQLQVFRRLIINVILCFFDDAVIRGRG